MLKSLHWKLTALYLFSALGLVVLLGAGTYALLLYFFQQSTDLAMQYKMATEFKILGLQLPAELAKSEQLWLQNNTHSTALPAAARATVTPSSAQSSDENEGDGATSMPGSGTPGYQSGDDHYDGELSPIFVIPLDSSGNQSPSTGLVSNLKIVDLAASVSAIQNGSDLRTTLLSNGTRVRLLTYRTGLASPAVLQVGRLLNDQDRVLNQYLTGLLILGATATIILALLSWWLAGRSLSPAQKAWDQQQTFVSNASHELRTPLTLMRATADYGLRSGPSGEQAKILQDIIDESDYMNHLVDDLLLLSRLDAHRLKLEHEVIDLSELLSDTLRQMEKVVQARGVSLLLDSSQGKIWGDRARVRQVLLILLDNALQFTPAGGTIRMSTKANGKFYEIRVTDSGIGIPAEHLPHLFERFYQVRSGGAEDSRSNGLGLSIAKSLIEAQHGAIHIESTPGKGTQVRLSLPARQ
jgi:signal transduction histidine kinase